MPSLSDSFFNDPNIEGLSSAHNNPPSSFVLFSSHADILRAINHCIHVQEFVIEGSRRWFGHEVLVYQWIFDCAPPSSVDLIIFLCLCYHVLDYFCRCNGTSLSNHSTFCIVSQVHTRLIVSLTLIYSFYLLNFVNKSVLILYIVISLVWVFIHDLILLVLTLLKFLLLIRER